MPKKLLVIGYVWPEPSTTAAGCRMQQLLDAFSTFGYHITFASTARKTGYSLDLEQMGVKEVGIQLNHSSFDEFVTQLSPDVVVFDRFMIEEQFGWRVAEFAPNAVRILNTEDLHALRGAREEAHKKHRQFQVKDWINHSMTIREVASIYRCDLSLMISTYEIRVLQQELHIPAELLLHLPFIVDVSLITEENLIPFEGRKNFVCIGNGKHPPNVDSIKVLKNEIWPLIRKQLLDAEIHIYGAYLPQQVNEMHDPKTGFYINGWAKNIDTVLEDAKVLLAPIQFGAGIKGKLLDAMRTGTPSVTTSIGAEGMYDQLDWNGTIANDWNRFSQAAVKLYQNQKLWGMAQNQGLKLINHLYDKTVLEAQLRNRVNHLCHNLKAHRQHNFIGKLLHHQTMAGTKYMAKWIEEKNRGIS
ncbi:MAG: glycosyltransferase family 4 protein [Flavobacteriaceae bacterium]|nr:glycosyltransferase family 4 protein [Flavobacteriaceae bacterium]